MSYTIEELRNMYENVNNISCKPGDGFCYPHPGTIFDTDKSLRWNSEEVERKRAAYKAEEKRIREARTAEFSKVYDEIYTYISEKTGLSKEKARSFWIFVYVEYHSFSTLFEHLDRYIDVYNSLKE